MIHFSQDVPSESQSGLTQKPNVKKLLTEATFLFAGEKIREKLNQFVKEIPGSEIIQI